MMERQQAKGLIKALENWAKKVTTGYRDVDVRDMSSSFRDGLAFCAIIHHYQPDLIDFDSLKREDILHNNSLAFSVAEKQLGVPALLDAEDMVKYAKPDRLSIITYLSQLRNCFENENKVNASSNGGIKRILKSADESPTKVNISIFGNAAIVPKRHELCQACNHRVYILERLIVDGKLYHRTCFKCSKCHCILNPGTYVESDTPGLYECSVCMPEEESTDTSITSQNGILPRNTKELSPSAARSARFNSILSDIGDNGQVNKARNSFLQNSLTEKSQEKVGNGIMKVEQSGNKISVKDKISAFEVNSKSDVPSTSIIDSAIKFRPSSVINSASPLESLKYSNRLSLNLNKSNSFHDTDVTKSNSAPKFEALSQEEIGEQSSTPESSRLSLNSNKSDSPDKADMTNNTFAPKVEISSQKKTGNQSSAHELAPVHHGAELEKIETLKSENTENQDSIPKPITSLRFKSPEYRTPMAGPRDIFKSGLQPLKLSIPSVRETNFKDSLLSPETKLPSLPVPQIRSTYAKSLPRSNSSSCLPPKRVATEASKDATDGNSKESVKWKNTARRRSSFESAEILPNKFNASIGFKEKDSELSKLTGQSTESGEILRHSVPLETHEEEKKSPIPTVRHSLERRKNSLDSGIQTSTDATDAESTISIDSNSSSVSKDIDNLDEPDSKVVVAAEKSPVTLKQVPTIAVQKDSVSDEKIYPNNLNPFGDDEEEAVGKKEYPDDLNPFRDEEITTNSTHTTEDYDRSKNPFASDDDDENEDAPVPRKHSTPKSSSVESPWQSLSSPTGSLRGTARKRLAPKPPPKMSEIFPNDSADSEADTSMSSMKSSPASSHKSFLAPSPKIHKSKPAPPPPPGLPPSRNNSRADLSANAKQLKEMDNEKLKANKNDENEQHQLKKKKRPAPPVPIPKRKDNRKIPLKEILQEMKEIESKQRDLEKQGKELELLIRDRDKDEEPTVEEEEYIMQLFELVNQKNALFRRQAELMYIKRSQRLEEQYIEIEAKIRELMQKPDDQKTDLDRDKEEELILELKDIVDQRSSIIDSIEMDRKRELQEDASVQEQIEVKNGDLPITAELKEKSERKEKKKREKMEKKKLKEEKKKKKEKDDSEKGTLKKKLFRSSKS